MKLPSVMVLPVDGRIGLSVVRGLGRERVPVSGVSCEQPSFALASRYLAQTYRLPLTQRDHLVPALLLLLRQAQPAALIATTEWAIRRLNAQRAQLSAHTQLLFPPSTVFEFARHKPATLALAQSQDVPVPLTYELPSAPAIADLAAHARFPLVVKPVAELEDPKLSFKYRIVQSPAELCAVLGRLAAHGHCPLVQEYCAGQGVGIETCLWRGQPLALFQHRRLRECDGQSTYCWSEAPDPQLVDWSLRLLRAMDWEGPAMVEFRQDPRTKRTVLLEVNGRFWGSLALPIQLGVNFPYLYYSAAVLGQPRFVHRYQPRVCCRWLSADTRWLTRVWRHPRAPRGTQPCGRWQALRAYLRAFWQCRRYMIEWRDDLAPARAWWRHRFLSLRQHGAPTPSE